MATLLRINASARKTGSHSRARAGIQAQQPRFDTTASEQQRLLEAFLKAAYAGELQDLKSLLSTSAQLHSDGGGKAEVAPRILVGTETVAQFMVNVLHERPSSRACAHIALHWFNGAPGALIHEHGRLVTALGVAVAQGVIQRLFAGHNPDKLSVFELVDRTRPAHK